jgi:DNA-binding GntR family transcriptional regulator
MKLQASPIPLYHQLQAHLLERVQAGEFSLGEPMPTEERLCEEYGVSRITVRRALDLLTLSGLISRRRGVGTFVAAPIEPVKSVRLVASLEDVISPTKDLSHKVFLRVTVEPPPLVSQALALPAGAKVVRLDTMNYSAQEPFAYSELFFPEEIGRLIQDSDIASGNIPILRLVEEKLQQGIVRAEQTVEAAVASRTVARHLGVKPKAAILKVLRTYYVEGDRPVEVMIARYHPARYRYTIRLLPQEAMP